MCCTRQEAKDVSLYAQNVYNLFDSPDFWCMRLSPLFSETIQVYQLLSVLFMLSCSGTCVFLYLIIVLSQYYHFPSHLRLKYYTIPPMLASIM